jgi:nucleoside-diphosphate-sugar epimerase
MNDVLSIVADLGGAATIRRLPVQRGDVRDTAADTGTALRGFGYVPQVGLREGLAKMVEAERPAASAAAGSVVRASV